jgi:hypothetical protein
MTKQNTLIHVNSNELNYTGDGAKNPQITDLNYGEIAINYKSGYETIFIKNDTDIIISFNPVSLTEKDLWNQKDRIFNTTKTVSVIAKDSGVTIGFSGNTATGNFSVAEGSSTSAIGNYSHSEGRNTRASGTSSHSEGNATTALGIYSHAEGTGTQSNGQASHAEGTITQAIGLFSHSEGEKTIASGNHSHAEGGYSTTASGTCSHAEGSGTTANGAASHTEGAFTIAYNTYEHAGGRYNSSTSGNSSSTGATIFSIGIGTSDSDRKNAIEVTQTGALIANTSWTTGSDRKLKDNITLLEDGVLDKVLKLKPSRFTLKADLEEEKRVQIGFIAQEIEEVFPEYVVIHTDNKGEETRYLDYEKICVVLTKALQEQQEIIDKQNERLLIIEQKLNIL